MTGDAEGELAVMVLLTSANARSIPAVTPAEVQMDPSRM